MDEDKNGKFLTVVGLSLLWSVKVEMEAVFTSNYFLAYGIILDTRTSGISGVEHIRPTVFAFGTLKEGMEYIFVSVLV